MDLNLPSSSTFHDFWIFGPVGSRIYGFEYTKLLYKVSEEIWEPLSKHTIFINVNILEIQHVDMFRKEGHRKKIRVTQISKILDMYCIAKKHEMDIW